MSGRKPNGVKAAWNEYNEARSTLRTLAQNPDPGQPGYSGPPVVALMGYRGPYREGNPTTTKPNVEHAQKALSELRRTNALRREVAQEFNAFGWVR